MMDPESVSTTIACIPHPSTMRNTSRTIRYLNRRSKRLQKREAGPLFVAGVALASILLLWAVGAVLFKFSKPPSTIASLPQTTFDLWPDSTQPIFQGTSPFISCLPQHYPDRCRIRHTDQKRRVVGILRPPGRLGHLLESFVRSSVKLLQDEHPEFEVELIASHRAESLLDRASQIIRPAVLPPLLEALDLILQTRDSDDNALLSVSQRQVETVLRQLLQWHCRISQKAGDMALLLLMLDISMAYPRMAQDALTEFLGLTVVENDNDKSNTVQMNALVQEVLTLIDEETTLLQGNRIVPASSYDWVQQVVQDEYLNEACVPVGETAHPSRVTKLVGAMLGDDLAAEHVACQTYPQSMLCRRVADDLL